MKKVAIVGVEGSGKTVMLAGLGELYSRPDEEGYFMSPKNFTTASYVADKIARMRRGEWPAATAEDALQGLDWTLRRKDGPGARPRDVCEVSCLDFAGEVYRAAFGIRAGRDVGSLNDEVAALKSYIRSADDIVVLINLRDVIARGVQDTRVQESMWITNAILSYALDTSGGRQEPRASIVLSQADSYADTIRQCGGAKGVLARYLPSVAANYDWLEVMALSAVNRTVQNDDGDMVPAPDFQPLELRVLMDWVVGGLTAYGDARGQVPTRKLPPRTRQHRPEPSPPCPPAYDRPAAARNPMLCYLDCWKKYCDFSGRATRLEYFSFLLFNVLAFVFLGTVSAGALGSLYALAVFLPSLAVFIRRLHDSNHTGLWWMVGLIPWLGWVALLVFALWPGTSGANRYGQNPR